MSNPDSGPRTDPGTFASLHIRLQQAVGDQYAIEKMLGHGGMGAVFLAMERKLARHVAIKVLPPTLSIDENVRARFLREARTAAGLDHPNIIPIYSVEDEDELDYFVMKYINGHSLADELGKSGTLPVARVQRILSESASALQHAHQRGVVHRDVKPANIMIDEGGRTMLTDFGISKALESATQFTATGHLIGTPHYMSPEQARGHDIDGRSDQYALAIVGYRMLTGQVPFDDNSLPTIIYKQIFETPTPLSELVTDIPPFLTDALHRGMAKDAAERFATMEEFGMAVWPENSVGFASSSGGHFSHVSHDAETELTPSTLEQRSHRGLAAGITAVAAAVIGLGAWFAFSGLGNSSESTAGVGSSAQIVAESAEGRPTDPATSAAIIPPTDTASADSMSPAGQEEPPVPASDARSATVSQPSTPVSETPPASRQRTQTPPPTPEVVSVGYLTVGAQPWGTVYIDGVEMGSTPLTRHELPPGSHTVEVRREGYQTTVDTVSITESNATILRKVLIREPS